MPRARPEHTLQTTALVHETYLRLEKQHAPQFQNREHFVAVCALLIRQILTGYERTRRAAKRGGGGLSVTLDDAGLAAKGRAVDLIALDDALTGLARLDPQQCQIVELRFFGGLSIEETAGFATCRADRSLAGYWPGSLLGASGELRLRKGAPRDRGAPVVAAPSRPQCSS